MVQAINNGNDKPTYNAVKINIRKPEINVGNNKNTYMDANGIYNAVNIDIDNPSINTEPKKIYDYPQAEEMVTYDMANIAPVRLPQYNIEYHTANFIIPNELNNENEVEDVIAEDITEPVTVADNTEEVVDEDVNEEVEPVIIPGTEFDEAVEIKDNIADDVKIMEAEIAAVETKKPEIIPGEEILPDVDIPLVISNLTNEDMDIQALQMEEIARLAFNNPEDAIPYIVTDVFTNLIDITNKDSSNLEPPTEEQIQARKKIITNFIVAQQAQQAGKPVQLPYEISENEVELAETLSKMEQAERNKEYALYTIAILAKIYADEIEKDTGNVVPLTDLPGSAAIVDALRYNNNSGVKIAAIDSLAHIQRPEYKNELTTLFTLAQADQNPQVKMVAERALGISENN